MRFNLYEMDDSVKALYAFIPESRTLPDGNEVVHRGCFVDNRDRAPFNSNHDNDGPSDGSVQDCARKAAWTGHKVFGVEAGGACFSASSVEQATSLGAAPMEECNKRDYANLPTGGEWRFNLYEMDESLRATYAPNPETKTLPNHSPFVLSLLYYEHRCVRVMAKQSFTGAVSWTPRHGHPSEEVESHSVRWTVYWTVHERPRGLAKPSLEWRREVRALPPPRCCKPNRWGPCPPRTAVIGTVPIYQQVATGDSICTRWMNRLDRRMPRLLRQKLYPMAKK